MAPTDPGERMGEAASALWTEERMRKRVKKMKKKKGL
jgi:hypothetical protein